MPTKEERPGLSPDLKEAATALETASNLVAAAARHLAASRHTDPPDGDQVLAYDLAHAASALAVAQAALRYGERGEHEARLAVVYTGDVLAELVARTAGREATWGTRAGWHGDMAGFLDKARSPAALSAVAEEPGPLHLDMDFELVRETFRRFADEQIAPRAEQIHRHNADVPESIINGLAEMGGFGLSIPERYGGFAAGGEHDYLAMVVATEELSRASLGAGGALITRPEILARALLKGGTEQQKAEMLPRIASGSAMVAVAVTEPDFGSDVASLSFTAAEHDGGYLLKGVKTWCTFAARAELVMLLARTDPDRSRGHRGLSLFVLEKPVCESSGFVLEQPGGGRLEGRPINTLGYRGLHSYELAFDNFAVPAGALVGAQAGLGQGFYLQMAGFENGRLQTAARALGVMQAAYEQAVAYARSRLVFGRPVLEYGLTRAKLGRMAAMIQACRQFSYEVAAMMGRGEGSLEASMVKAYACRAAEWVTREAMQLHGGMGYAEEFPVSRLFVDARVLSIFEGADETLCLKVIARRLAAEAEGHSVD